MDSIKHPLFCVFRIHLLLQFTSFENWRQDFGANYHVCASENYPTAGPKVLNKQSLPLENLACTVLCCFPPSNPCCMSCGVSIPRKASSCASHLRVLHARNWESNLVKTAISNTLTNQQIHHLSKTTSHQTSSLPSSLTSCASTPSPRGWHRLFSLFVVL